MLSNTEVQLVVNFFWCTYAFKPCPLLLDTAAAKVKLRVFCERALVHSVCASFNLINRTFVHPTTNIYRSKKLTSRIVFLSKWAHIPSITYTFRYIDSAQHISSKYLQTSVSHKDDLHFTGEHKWVPKYYFVWENILWKLEVPPFCLLQVKYSWGRKME